MCFHVHSCAYVTFCQSSLLLWNFANIEDTGYFPIYCCKILFQIRFLLTHNSIVYIVLKTYMYSSWCTCSSHFLQKLNDLCFPVLCVDNFSLFQMISEYCKFHDEKRPFSHLMMDLYKEVTETLPQVSNIALAILYVHQFTVLFVQFHQIRV
jgi:hypothetical protein